MRVARPVAVAETVGGQNDQLAVVRLRQGGENDLQLTFYKVDDLAGTIDGLAPGHPAYAAAVQAHAIQTVSGASAITGPGYGQFSQTLLQGIDAGDIVAMRLDNLTTGAFYWAFANANETGRRPAGRPSVELRAQHLGLGGHLWAAATATSTTWSCKSTSPAPRPRLADLTEPMYWPVRCFR